MRLIYGCCDGGNSNEIDEILTHLAQGIELVVVELTKLKLQCATSSDQVALFAPYLGRALLEMSFTAIVARLDPFRLLAIRRMQMAADYDPSTAMRNAIRWQGDVIAAKPKDIWAASVDPKDVSRALFGDYYDELIWRPAFTALADAKPVSKDSRLLSELLLVPAETFCIRKRESVNKLFSQLSKSVHMESVTPTLSIDGITAIDLVQRVIREVSEVALVSHFVPHSYSRFEQAEALAIFSEIEGMEIMQ